MWICLNDGFLSVVRDRTGHDRLLVRSRRMDHLMRSFPNQVIETSSMADYGWRARIDRERLTEVVAARIKSIDYPNFKASVADPDLHALYEDFWHLHSRYQRKGSD